MNDLPPAAALRDATDAITHDPQEHAPTHPPAVGPYLTVEEFRRLTKTGRSTVYSAIRSKSIPSIRIGRVVRIPISALQSQD